MRDGKVVEQGEPREICAGPRNPFTAGFLGISNVVEGTVESIDGAVASVRSSLGPISSPTCDGVNSGDTVDVHLRPASLQLSATPATSSARKAVVEVGVYRREHTDYEVRSGEQTLKVRAYRSDQTFDIGGEVWLSPLHGAALLARKDTATPSAV
jgi:ABC-type Fe3+/spermidine/putrescine transport system ATPase subunit